MSRSDSSSTEPFSSVCSTASVASSFRESTSTPLPSTTEFPHQQPANAVISPLRRTVPDMAQSALQEEPSTTEGSQLVLMSSMPPQELSPNLLARLRSILSLPQRPINSVLSDYGFINDDTSSYSDTAWVLLYLSNSLTKESAPSFFALYIPSGLILPEHEKRGVQFVFNVNKRTKKITFDNRPDLRNYDLEMFHEDLLPLEPDAPILAHGLIMYLGDWNPSDDLLLDDTSFLVFLPPKSNFSVQQLFSRFKQNLESIKSRCPKLKHLLFKDISIDDVKITYFIQQLELDAHFL
jgi:hypothetical protein